MFGRWVIGLAAASLISVAVIAPATADKPAKPAVDLITVSAGPAQHWPELGNQWACQVFVEATVSGINQGSYAAQAGLFIKFPWGPDWTSYYPSVALSKGQTSVSIPVGYSQPSEIGSLEMARVRIVRTSGRGMNTPNAPTDEYTISVPLVCAEHTP